MFSISAKILEIGENLTKLQSI